MKNLILILFIVVTSVEPVVASHIVGGEMSYTCLGNDNYRIELKLYRDCYNGAAAYDDPTNIFVFDDMGNLVSTIHIPFPGSDTIPATSNCGIPVLSTCVEEAIFVDTVNLPASSGGYTLVYQRCCLSYIINNIMDASDHGVSIFATIPDASVASCNNSPEFIAYPPTFFCTGVPINFDHSAIDPDGDSLVYELCAGIEGGNTANPYPNPPLPPPYDELIYDAGYSGSYPITTDPVLAIDPVTGVITGTPTAIGVYFVCVCVKEYRDGNLLSVHRRVITVYTEAYFLGSGNPLLSGSLNIFPNPVNGIMKVDLSSNTFENDEWRIYNSQGALINEARIETNANAIELNVVGYAEGVYHFQWIHDDTVITKAFMISR